MHRARLDKHGSYDKPERKSRKGEVRVASPKYRAAHMRVDAVRGKASTHKCGCGKQAQQWAYDHTDDGCLTTSHPNYRGELVEVQYSAKIEHYIAMCIGCHTLFDKNIRIY